MGHYKRDIVPRRRQRAFLAAFRETGNVRLACKAANVGRSSHYRWFEKDPEYRTAFDQAKEDATDVLEAEAFRRAVEGVEEPTGWYMGEPGGTVRKYSDVLLIFLLKSLRPDRYRERVDVRGVLAHLDVSLLPDELVARLANGENPISVLAPVLQGELPALGPGEEGGESCDVSRGYPHPTGWTPLVPKAILGIGESKFLPVS